MILVTASLMKTASGWWFNLANELLASNGGDDTRELRTRWHLERLIEDHNCRIGSLRAHRLAPLLVPSLAGRSFAVKTHSTPRPALRALLRTGLVRGTFNVRDPRDMALSALEHGARDRAAGNEHGLSHLETIDDAVAHVAKLLPNWEAWTSIPSVMVVRYEDLILDPAHELERLASLLKLELPPGEAARVVASVGGGARDWKGLHFNTGTAGRHREVLADAERDLCEERLRPLVLAMGYKAA